MSQSLSFFGFLDIQVEAPQASDLQRLEEFALEVGRVDVRPGEFYKEVLDLMARGVERPEDLADAALRIVRGAETINAMVARCEGANPQNGISCGASVSLAQLINDESECQSSEQFHLPPSADRLPHRWS
jgi:hypothetical protein